MTVDGPPDRGVVRVRDGRRFGWAAWGPTSGRPVLLSPGAGTSRSLGLARGCAERAGIRLVSHDRPGFGASDPSPFRSLVGVAADLLDLCCALELGMPPVVGHSQGAPFALAAAAAGVVGPVLLVSPIDELSHPSVHGLVPAAQRELVDLATMDPEAAQAVLEGFDAAGLRAMITAGADDRDRAVYEAPGFDEVWRRATDEAFLRGPGGYAADTRIVMAPWGLDLDAIGPPVEVWIGAGDATHSPDGAAALSCRLGARHVVVPDAGGSLLWTHGDLLLAGLAELTG